MGVQEEGMGVEEEFVSSCVMAIAQFTFLRAWDALQGSIFVSNSEGWILCLIIPDLERVCIEWVLMGPGKDSDSIETTVETLWVDWGGVIKDCAGEKKKLGLRSKYCLLIGSGAEDDCVNISA